MGEQHAGLDVRHAGRALFLHRRKEGGGIAEALAVPLEHAAFALHRRIARGEVEAVEREAPFPHGVGEGEHRRVAVPFQLRVVHARALIAKGAFGRQRGPPGEQRVVVHDPRDRAAADQEEVDVAAVGAPARVPGAVVAPLRAEIVFGLVKVVEEQAHGLPGPAAQADGEGDVLVERVALLRVVAHGVGRALAERALVLVERSPLLAEAVKAVVVLHAGIEGNAAVAVAQKGVGRERRPEGRPGPVEKPDAERIAVQLQTQRGALEDEAPLRLRERRLHGLDAGALQSEERVEAVGPGGRHQDVGLLRERPVERDAQADDFVGDENQPAVGRVGMQEKGAVKALKAQELRADFHGALLVFRFRAYCSRLPSLLSTCRREKKAL